MKTTVINIKDCPSNWQRNTDYIYCGRAGHGLLGEYGNQHLVGFCLICKCSHSRREAIAAFKQDAQYRLRSDASYRQHLAKLRGKYLVCFCKPLDCHCDVYIELEDEMNWQFQSDPGPQSCSCWTAPDPMCHRGRVIGNHPLRGAALITSGRISDVNAPGSNLWQVVNNPFAYALAPQRSRVRLSVADIRRAGGYKVIYADCPWHYDDQNCNGAAEQVYSSMTFDQLCSLPIAQIAAADCALFTWATYPKIQDALNLIPYWGFEYKSYAFDWVKLRGGRPQMGLGRWTRGASEVCLLAVRGKPQRQDKSVRQLVETLITDDDRTLYAPATRHSAKPPEIRDRIVQLMGDVPRLEMFARERTPGWDVYGDQIDSDIVL